MIRCFNCASENFDGTRYCNYCGALLQFDSIGTDDNKTVSETGPLVPPSPVNVNQPEQMSLTPPVTERLNPPIPEDQGPDDMVAKMHLPPMSENQIPHEQTYANEPISNFQTTSQGSSANGTNGLSIAGFVLSLLSLLCCGVTSIISLILCLVGLITSKKDNGGSSSLAIAGIVISGVGVLFTLIYLVSCRNLFVFSLF